MTYEEANTYVMSAKTVEELNERIREVRKALPSGLAVGIEQRAKARRAKIEHGLVR